MFGYLKAAGALLLLAGLGVSHWLAYQQGGKAGAVELAEYKATVAERATKVAELARDAANKARAAEQQQAERMAGIAEQYEDDKSEASQAAYDRALADVRSGRVRLRGPWACPVPGPAATPGGRDAAAELRAEAAGRVVRIGADADAQLRACQAVIQSYRNP